MKGPRVGFWLHCPLWTSGAFYLLVRVVPVNGLVEEQGTGVDCQGVEEVQLVEVEDEEADADLGTS